MEKTYSLQLTTDEINGLLSAVGFAEDYWRLGDDLDTISKKELCEIAENAGMTVEEYLAAHESIRKLREVAEVANKS